MVEYILDNELIFIKFDSLSGSAIKLLVSVDGFVVDEDDSILIILIGVGGALLHAKKI